MKIVVDTCGGDKKVQEVVKGAIKSLSFNKDFKVVLVGPEEEINSALKDLSYDKERVEVVNSTEVITCNDAPMEAIRKKPDSSLIKACKVLKEDEDAKAFVSTGSTGAVLASGIFKVGRIDGVLRPALAPLIPTLTGGKVMLIDSGANVDCKKENLVQFALMGSSYMQKVEKISKPRVALISNGTEDKKGCELTKEVFKLLSENPNINFVGNMEARDMVSGKYDVLVADGFDGNIALKALEGGAKTVTTLLKQGIKSSFWAKIGYLFLKKTISGMKEKIDFNKIGGAVFMGVEKIMIKAHGASDSDCVAKCITQAFTAVESDVVGCVREAIGKELEQN
ncbi:MAG TPA: phosphate acyltransferase PlsX [Clostridiales bacterium]|nr:phosphate acyltransferase PlsX [Clostridiales bacterium]